MRVGAGSLGGLWMAGGDSRISARADTCSLIMETGCGTCRQRVEELMTGQVAIPWMKTRVRDQT